MAWNIWRKAGARPSCLTSIITLESHSKTSWQSPSDHEDTGSIVRQFMWNAWWKKWQWNMFVSKYMSFSIIIILPTFHTHISFIYHWHYKTLAIDFIKQNTSLSLFSRGSHNVFKLSSTLVTNIFIHTNDSHSSVMLPLTLASVQIVSALHCTVLLL